MTNQHPKFTEGLRLFNEGSFHAAHEAIEEIWLKDFSKDRSGYQGLIILAGAFYHAQKGRFGPALKALSKAMARLKQYRPRFYGIDLEGLLDELQVIENEWMVAPPAKIRWPHL